MAIVGGYQATDVVIRNSSGAIVDVFGGATSGAATAANQLAANDSLDAIELAATSTDPALTNTGLQSNWMYAATVAVTPKFAPIAASALGLNAIVPAVVGKKLRVLAYNFTSNGAVNAKWQSATTDKTGFKYMPAAGYGIEVGFCPVGLLETAVGEALNLNLSAAVAVGGEVIYVEV